MSRKILVVGNRETGLGGAVTAAAESAGHTVVNLSRSESSHVQLDLESSDGEIRDRVREALDALGGAQSLVLTSGMGAYTHPRASMDKAKRLMQVNFFGPVAVFNACLGALIKEQGNAMFVTSSVYRAPGAPDLPLYAASKGAVHSFVTSEARRMIRKNVSLFTFTPGWFDSPMVEDIPRDRRERITQSIPARKFGDAAELAAFALQLLLQSNWITTGRSFEATGGA